MRSQEELEKLRELRREADRRDAMGRVWMEAQTLQAHAIKVLPASRQSGMAIVVLDDGTCEEVPVVRYQFVWTMWWRRLMAWCRRVRA